MIRGEGEFSFIGKGITSYPNGDKNNKRIHAGCLELEERGEIYQHCVGESSITWMPTTQPNG